MIDDNTTIPDHVPADLQRAFGAEARRVVASSVAAPTATPAVRTPPPFLIAAAGLGFVALIVLSLMWTWLAVTVDMGAWIAYAAGGWLVTLALPGVLAKLWSEGHLRLR